MVKKIVKLVVVLVLLAGAVWLYQILFPSHETQIRRELVKLSERASFTGTEGNIKRIATASALVDQFALDAEIIVEIPGEGIQALRGRPEIQQTLLGAMSRGFSLKIEFHDIVVNVASDEQSAIVELTAKIFPATMQDFVLQELQFQMLNGESGWVIKEIRTLQTFR